MKKTWAALAAAAIGLAGVAGLAGCDDEPAPAVTTASSEAEPTVIEEPNPIETVDGPEAFADRLGLKLAADPAGTGAEYAIIGGVLAQVIYQGEVDGQAAEITVRLQKTPGEADIAGDYDTYATIEAGAAVGDVTPTLNFNAGAAGYVTWYDAAAGLSGSAAVSAHASADALNALAAHYITAAQAA